MQIINTIFFLLSSQLFLISIVGFGEKLKFSNQQDLDLNFFLNFFYGLILINILGFFLYYLNLNNKILNLIIFLTGILFFDFKKYKKIIVSFFSYNIIFFSGILISKLHEDWPYHFSYIEQISSLNPIIGIGNIDDITILSASFFAYAQKIFYLPFFNFQVILIPSFLIYLNLIFFLIRQVINNLKLEKEISYIYLFIVSLLLIKINRLSEFGYDYLSNFLLINILILFIYELYKKKDIYDSIWIYSLFFIYACTIKITSVFFLPIFLSIFFYKFKSKKLNKIFYLNIFLVLSFIIDSFLRSGCVLYAIKFTCFSEKSILWATDPVRISEYSNLVVLWAKGFYHQNLYTNAEEYVQNFNWISNWISIHFFYKVFEFLFIPIIFLIYIFLNKFSKFNTKIHSILFFSTILSLLIWFNSIPQLRFGTGILIFSFTLIMISFLNKKTLKNFKTKYVYFWIIFLICIYNVKNLNRIYNEFHRNDMHKFTNFPFPPKKRLKQANLNTNGIKYLLYTNKKVKKIFWFNLIY